MPALATQLAGGRVSALPSQVGKRTASAAKKLSLLKNLPSALPRKPAESTARPMEALPESAGNLKSFRLTNFKKKN